MITSPADTLVCDSAQLAAFRSDAAYDYNRELITPEINIFEWIRGQFGELLGKIFGSRFAEEIGTFVREVRPVIYGGRVISAEQMKLYIDKMSEIINHI